MDIYIYISIYMYLSTGPLPFLMNKDHFFYLIDVGFHSVCYEYVLLPLVNKEAALAYSRAEYSQAGRDIYSHQSQRDAM